MSVRSQQTREKIEQIMKDVFSPAHIEIEDESWKHKGHAGASSGGGHFSMIVVSGQFEGVRLLDRNRMVFDALSDLMKDEIHALSVKAKTPAEWKR